MMEPRQKEAALMQRIVSPLTELPPEKWLMSIRKELKGSDRETRAQVIAQTREVLRKRGEFVARVSDAIDYTNRVSHARWGDGITLEGVLLFGSATGVSRGQTHMEKALEPMSIEDLDAVLVFSRVRHPYADELDHVFCDRVKVLTGKMTNPGQGRLHIDVRERPSRIAERLVELAVSGGFHHHFRPQPWHFIGGQAAGEKIAAASEKVRLTLQKPQSSEDLLPWLW